MFYVTGIRSTIVAELAAATGETPTRILGNLADLETAFDLPPPSQHARRFVLAQGVLRSAGALQQSGAEIAEGLAVNLANVIRLGETILETLPTARVCIVGSESAWRGCFDPFYCAAKAGVTAWAATRRILDSQQLIVVAPPIISDSAMTRRRHDYPAVLNTRRTVTAADVAGVIWRRLWAPEWKTENRVVEFGT